MQAREFRDGAKDGLDALEPLDPDRIDSFTDLITAMRKTAFGGRRVGEAFDACCQVRQLLQAQLASFFRKLINRAERFVNMSSGTS